MSITKRECVASLPLAISCIFIIYNLSKNNNANAGLWFMVYGLWFMVYGLWFMVYGLWLVACLLSLGFSLGYSFGQDRP